MGVKKNVNILFGYTKFAIHAPHLCLNGT